MPHAGADSARFREVEELGRIAGRLGELVGSRVESRVAILHDYQAIWAAEGPCMPSSELDALTAAQAIHRALHDRGVTADVVHPSADLTAYAVVVVPQLYLVTDEHAAAVAAAAEAGAQVLVTYFSGISDEHDHVRLGGYPGAFRDLLGVRVEEFFPLGPDETVALAEGTGTWWSEDVTALPGTDVLTTYAAGPLTGRPAVTRRAGDDSAGSAWYLSTLPDDATLGALLDDVLSAAGVEPAVAGPSPRRRDDPPQRRAPARGSSCSTTRTPSTRRGNWVRPRRGRPCRRHRPPRPGWRGRDQGGLTMLASQRRSVILELVEESGAVKVSDLVERLGVSDMTIRRDIERLSTDGLLERVHGGALALGDTRSSEEPGFSAKSLLQLGQKQAIAQAAAQRVEPGSAIGISAGTTTYELARAVKDVPQLTVVTNSVPGRRSCSTSRAHRARRSCSPVGCARPPTPSSARSPSRPCAPSTSTCSSSARTASTPATGLTTPNLVEAETNQALVASARHVCVLADSSKWGTVGLSTFADLSESRPVRHRRRPARSAPAPPLREAVGSLEIVEA